MFPDTEELKELGFENNSDLLFEHFAMQVKDSLAQRTCWKSSKQKNINKFLTLITDRNLLQKQSDNDLKDYKSLCDKIGLKSDYAYMIEEIAAIAQNNFYTEFKVYKNLKSWKEKTPKTENSPLAITSDIFSKRLSEFDSKQIQVAMEKAIDETKIRMQTPESFETNL